MFLDKLPGANWSLFWHQDNVIAVNQRLDLPGAVERDEDGWYVGTVSELPGCHTQAKSPDQLRERIHEAIRAYIGPRKSVPKGIEFVGVQTIEV